MLLLYQVKCTHKAGLGRSTVVLGKGATVILFCSAQCCFVFPWHVSLNLRIFKLGICWCDFLCLSSQKSSLTPGPQVVLCGPKLTGERRRCPLGMSADTGSDGLLTVTCFKSEEILNHHMYLFALCLSDLFPPNLNLGFCN